MSQRITNASPLLFLAKLDRVELLCLGVQEVFVPSIVLAEIYAKGDLAAERIKGYLGRGLRECLLTRPE